MVRVRHRITGPIGTRMPTRVREIMIAHVRSFVLAALADVVVNPLTPAILADLLRRVGSIDSSDISLGPGNGRSSPDGSIGYLGARVPAVVIEVSNSRWPPSPCCSCCCGSSGPVCGHHLSFLNPCGNGVLQPTAVPGRSWLNCFRLHHPLLG